MKEINEEYCGLHIIIRNGKGVVRKGKAIFHEIIQTEDQSIAEMHEILKNKVIATRISQLSLSNSQQKTELECIKGLMQLPKYFGSHLLNSIKSYETNQGSHFYVRFGVLGILSEGKPGQPNYQIESENGEFHKTFRYTHQEFDTNSEGFNSFNLTNRFSSNDLRSIWLITE